MGTLDFFAAKEDLRALLAFLFEETDARVFEHYSEYDQELREFRSVEQVESTFPQLGSAQSGRQSVLLQLWSPSVEADLEVQRIELDPRRCRGATFRYTLENSSSMQLYLGGVVDRTITVSHFGHNSEARARKWGNAAGVDWSALKTLSNRIRYHIRQRLAAAKVPGRPVLGAALRLLSEGHSLEGVPADVPVVTTGPARKERARKRAPTKRTR